MKIEKIENLVNLYDKTGYVIQKRYLKQLDRPFMNQIDHCQDKTAKGTEKCVIKKLKFENYKNCLETIKLEHKINHHLKLPI